MSCPSAPSNGLPRTSIGPITRSSTTLLRAISHPPNRFASTRPHDPPGRLTAAPSSARPSSSPSGRGTTDLLQGRCASASTDPRTTSSRYAPCSPRADPSDPPLRRLLRTLRHRRRRPGLIPPHAHARLPMLDERLDLRMGRGVALQRFDVHLWPALAQHHLQALGLDALAERDHGTLDPIQARGQPALPPLHPLAVLGLQLRVDPGQHRYRLRAEQLLPPDLPIRLQQHDLALQLGVVDDHRHQLRLGRAVRCRRGRRRLPSLRHSILPPDGPHERGPLFLNDRLAVAADLHGPIAVRVLLPSPERLPPITPTRPAQDAQAAAPRAVDRQVSAEG